MRIVIIGGVAAGMSAASQAKRRQPNAEVVVLERGTDVSYGACGMPYNLEDPNRSMEDLVVITAERFRRERGIDVRTRHHALEIDRQARLVDVHDIAADRRYRLEYDALILATGAHAVEPPVTGLDLPQVFFLRALADGTKLKGFLEDRSLERAVIVGAGYIGMEMAEALRHRGLSVDVVEKLDQVIPGFDADIAGIVEERLEHHGVRIHTGVTVERIEIDEKGEGVRVHCDSGTFPADLVLVSVGVRPNVKLAEDAGLSIGPTGAIAVDDAMRTSDPHIYAAGDCAEAYHRILGRPAYVPLGTTANKQGKVAGANATGGRERFAGILGTAGFRVFDLEVARTGLGPVEIARAGWSVVRAASRQRDRGHGYPGASEILTVLLVDPESRRVLGAQMIGRGAVATRIDVFAAALHARMTVEDVASLDLAYAPPFAPVYDPILIAATQARKALGRGMRG